MEVIFLILNQNAIEHGLDKKDYVDIIFLGATVLLSSLSAYLGSYFSKKGGVKAVKHDYEFIKNKHKDLEKITQEIKSRLDKDSILYQIEKSQEVSRKIDSVSEIVRKGKQLGLSLLSGNESNRDMLEFKGLIVEYRIKSISSLFWVGDDVIKKIDSLVIEVDNNVYNATLLMATDPIVNHKRYSEEEKDRQKVKRFFLDLDDRILKLSKELKKDIFD